MAAKTVKKEVPVCPVGKFCMDFEKQFGKKSKSGKKSKFVSHLNRSHIEALKAIRSLVDERIADLDRKAKASAKRKKKMRSIRVD